MNIYLLGDDDQWVSVLRQEVEDAPDLESVVVGDVQLVQIQVFPGAQRPAHFVEVLTIKVICHLWQSITTVVSHRNLSRQTFPLLTFPSVKQAGQ